MQVTAIELEGVEGHESIMYDITLCELDDWVARSQQVVKESTIEPVLTACHYVKKRLLIKMALLIYLKKNKLCKKPPEERSSYSVGRSDGRSHQEKKLYN